MRFTSPRLDTDPLPYYEIVRDSGSSIDAADPPTISAKGLPNQDSPILMEFSEGTGAVGLSIIDSVGVDDPVFVLLEDFSEATRLMFINANGGSSTFIGFDSRSSIKRVMFGHSWVSCCLGKILADDVYYAASNPFQTP